MDLECTSSNEYYYCIDERTGLLTAEQSAHAHLHPKTNSPRKKHNGSPPKKHSRTSGPGRVPARCSNVIEPVLFFFLVSKSLSDTVITNLLENRTCLVDLHLSDRDCSEPIPAKIENLIQPETADVIMARSFVEAFLPSLLTLLVGPWSDTNGRKPFLIIALIGQAVSYLTWGSLSMVHDIHPPLFLFASLPISFSGGCPIVYLLVFCYITDVTDDESRAFRLALLSLAVFTSSIVGIACAPLIVSVQATINPYPLVFFISSGLLSLTVVYTICFLSETVDVNPERDRCLFQFSNLSKMCKACFCRRGGRGRFMILTIMSTLTLNVFISEGESSVLYLSAREMFSWTLFEYTLYLIGSCISGPGSVIGVWFFTSVLGLTSIEAATLTLATRIVRSPMMALATTSWYFYLANALCFLSCAYAPLARSELSRLVPREDLGKIFALTAFLESITPVIATPLYTCVYTATYLNAPGTVYWISAAVTVITVLMLLSVAITQRLVSGNFYARKSSDDSNYVRIGA